MNGAQFINKFEILEQNIFIEYIGKNSIYFYEFDFMDCQMIRLLKKKIIVMLNINYDLNIQMFKYSKYLILLNQLLR